MEHKDKHTNKRENDLKAVGERIKAIRADSNMSQISFGEKIGLSKSGISAVENGKTFMSFEVLSTLLIDLDVNLNYLIGGIGEKYNKNAAQYDDVKEDIMLQVRAMLKDEGIIK